MAAQRQALRAVLAIRGRHHTTGGALVAVEAGAGEPQQAAKVATVALVEVEAAVVAAAVRHPGPEETEESEEQLKLRS